MTTRVSNNLITGVFSIAQGGTGANTAAQARINLGITSSLGTMASQNSNSVSITGGTISGITISGITDLAIADGGTGASTAALAANNLGLGTTSSVRFGSLGVGTNASGTTGEIRATNDITGFYSSDKRLKTNIKNINNSLEKIMLINGVSFEWTDEYINSKGGEDGYFVRKKDVGVIAQEIEKVLPESVAEREDGIKAVNYEKIIALLIEAIKELKEEVEQLKKKV